jgi:hypothetical protein
MTEDRDTDNYEIIDVRLPRKDYQLLQQVLEREKTWSWIARWMKSGFLWTVVTVIMMLMTFWEQIKRVFN